MAAVAPPKRVCVFAPAAQADGARLAAAPTRRMLIARPARNKQAPAGSQLSADACRKFASAAGSSPVAPSVSSSSLGALSTNCPGVLLGVSGLPRCAAAHQLAELKHNRIGNAVEDAVSGPLAAHKPSVEQNLKVFRYVRLISFQALDDLVDGHGSALKCLQNAQAARLAEDLEAAGNQFDHLPVDHILCPIGCRRRCPQFHYIIIQEYS